MTSLKPVCRYIVFFRNKLKPTIFSQNAGFIKQNTNGNQKWTRSRQRIVRNETKPTNAFFETIERYHNYGSSFEQDSVFISHLHLIHYINYLMKIHVELTRTIFTNLSPMLHLYTHWKCQKIKILWRFQEIQKLNIGLKWVNPFSSKPTKWSNSLNRFVGKLQTNSLSVFDHFEGLALKGLKEWICQWIEFHEIR